MEFLRKIVDERVRGKCIARSDGECLMCSVATVNLLPANTGEQDIRTIISDFCSMNATRHAEPGVRREVPDGGVVPPKRGQSVRVFSVRLMRTGSGGSMRWGMYL